MPSSGTRPGRRDRGAGNGSIQGQRQLACGHPAQGQPVAGTAARQLYWCGTCHSYQARS